MISVKEHRKTIEAVFVAIVALYAAYLGQGLLASNGFPSFDKGLFHTATLAYYVEWSREASAYGLYTPAWCGGFDLLRFYPPLGLVVLHASIAATGPLQMGAKAAYLAALVLFYVSVYAAARIITGSRLAGLAAALSASMISGYVATMVVYWEYTRLFGEAFAVVALAFMARFLSGNIKDREHLARLFAFFLSLTLLSHLIAAVEAGFAAVAAFAAYSVYRRRLQLPLATQWKLLLIVLALTAWWLVPALAPFGLSHYMRIRTPLSLTGSILRDSLSLWPPLYEPAVQAPVLGLGVAAAILGVARRDLSPLLVFAAALALLVPLYGQGPRLTPFIGLLLLIGFIDSMYRASRLTSYIALAVLAVFFVAYASQYISIYHKGLVLDDSYKKSDEYIVANYLASAMKPGERAYLMYGPRLHGNQWVNVFEPRVWQVLSGFIEGCIRPEYLMYDVLVKEGYNYTGLYLLSRSLCVSYIVVDKEWYNETHAVSIRALQELGLLEEVKDINRLLNYSLVFRVKGVEGCGGVAPSRAETLLVLATPSRLLGFIVSLAAASRYWRKRKA